MELLKNLERGARKRWLEVGRCLGIEGACGRQQHIELRPQFQNGVFTPSVGVGVCLHRGIARYLHMMCKYPLSSDKVDFCTLLEGCMENFFTIVLTGATNGLGRIAASALARPGVRLVLVARNKSKAEATRSELLREAPGTEVDYVLADFTSLAAVAQAGADIAARYPQINVLINNAGIHAFEQRVTTDGFSEMVSTNYLAPWLLTHYLRPSLIAVGPSRVVTVGSEASRRSQGLDIERDLTDTRPFSRLGSSVVYGKTKLMDIMFSAELARSLASTAVVANSLDPGFNVTGLGRELPFAAMLERVLRLFRVGAPQRGADIMVRLATAEAFSGVTGGYFSRAAEPLTPVKPADDQLAQQMLWQTTARLLTPYCKPAAEFLHGL